MKQQLKPFLVTTSVVVICFFSSYKKDELRQFFSSNPLSFFKGENETPETAPNSQAVPLESDEIVSEDAPPKAGINPFSRLNARRGRPTGQNPIVMPGNNPLNPNPLNPIRRPERRNNPTAAAMPAPPGNAPYRSLIDMARMRELQAQGGSLPPNPLSANSLGSSSQVGRNEYFNQLSERLRELQGDPDGKPTEVEKPEIPVEDEVPADNADSSHPNEGRLDIPHPPEFPEESEIVMPERELNEAESNFLEQLEALEDVLAEEALLNE